MHKPVFLNTGTKRKGETPARSVKLSSVTSSGRRINCRDLSEEACRNARTLTLTALVSTRLSEFAKADACYRLVMLPHTRTIRQNILSWTTKCAHERADGVGLCVEHHAPKFQGHEEVHVSNKILQTKTLQ